jgi:hypothetical protein
VNAVVEIDVVRKPMHANPLDGFVGSVTLANGLQVTGIIEENGMTVHAGFSGRDSGGGGGFYAGMTIAAIDAVVARMMFVAELNRLLAGDVLVRQIGSTRQTHHSAKGKRGE